MTRKVPIVFPSFSGQNYQPFEMRQLVSAIELRFQALEEESTTFPATDQFSDEFAPIDHTHVEADITDLGNYLTNITAESIFDLSDVTGTPSGGQALVWNGSAFQPQTIAGGGGGANYLNDLLDVTAPSPNNQDVLRFDTGTGQWVPVALTTSTVSVLNDLDDVLTGGQLPGDLLYNVDGTNWGATTGLLSWDGTTFNIGDPGSEAGSIQVNGLTYSAVTKINEFGGTNDATLVLHRHDDSPGVSSNVIYARARGETATHSDVVQNDVIGRLGFVGWNTSSYYLGAEIDVVVDGTPGVGDMPMAISLKTSPDGSATPVERVRINEAGMEINGVAHDTHTGEVTGGSALTVEVTSITNKTDIGVECDPADDLAVHDDSAGDLKKLNVSVITDGGYF